MYNPDLAGPSDEAHRAAAALDSVFEAVADGVSVTDLAVLPQLLPFIQYIFDTEIDRGEAISRALQLVSLVERDNTLISKV